MLDSILGLFTMFDETTAASFLVEVDGLPIGRFTEVSGLSLEIDVEEYEEGGENGFVHKFPGRMKWPNITLKRGVTMEDWFMAWVESSVGTGAAIRSGKTTRSTAAITLLSPMGIRLRRWNIVDAFPVRWTGPNFSRSSTEVAMEELEIAHHGFTSV